MKIYFAGSIRGGREDVPLYLEIVKELKKYGEVLTEHVADASITNYGENDHTDQELYERDVKMIREADCFVAEVTNTSLGVGYEIGFAESLGKKTLCLYRPKEGKRLSAMLNGNMKLTVVRYSKIEELQVILEKFFLTK